MKLTWVILLIVLASFTAKAQNKLTVYVFFGENCPICQHHTLTLNNLTQKYAAQGVEIIGVFPNPESDSAAIEEFKQKYKIKFALKKDEGRKLMKHFGATITPEVFVVANDSVYYKGGIDDRFAALGKRKTTPVIAYLENAIDALLQGEAVEVKETKAVGCFIDSEY